MTSLFSSAPAFPKVGAFCYAVTMKQTVNVAHARNKKKLYEKIMRDKVCPFCVDFSEKKDVFQYHTKPILFHAKHWARTPFPYFMLKKHIVSFSELKPAALKELVVLTKKLEEKFSLPAGVFLFRFGDTNYTGGSVSHFHGQFVLGAKRSKKNSEPLLLYAGYKKAEK